ncbi:MAG: TMEM14 family protein [Verrucomicrobiota bacterium]|nr:TMEM14 family protein [Verrucomicrobiota bacterium]
MIGFAKIYFLIFGALTIAGGVMGYVSKGSVPSLIAGTISGLLLLLAAFLLPERQMIGLIIALVVSLLLAAQFVPKLLRGGKMMPAGMMSVLSVLGLIAAIAAWLRK